MKRFLVLALLLLSFIYAETLSAQTRTKRTSSKRTTENQTYVPLENAEDRVKAIRKEILSGKSNKQKINYLHVKGYVEYFQSLLKHPGLEYKTRISEKWYKKLLTYLLGMYKAKSRMRDYQMNKDKENYLAANASYRKNAKAFIALVKKPKTLDKDEYKKAKEKYNNFMKKQRELAKDRTR